MEPTNLPQEELRKAVDSEDLTEGFFKQVLEEGIGMGAFRTDTSPLLPALIKPLLQDWYVKRAKYKRRSVTIDTYISTVQDLVESACLAERSATALTGTKS